MKIAYFTAETPWGLGETFILEEMIEVKNQNVDLLIIPRNPPREIFHKEAKQLLENAIRLPLINFKIVISFLKALFTKISFWKILRTFIEQSRNLLIVIKNLAVLPKGVFIAGICQKEKIDHIHAHWGSTTSTMAYVISQITGIPWSFTLHRWDIKENNILKEKARSAKFVRCISEHGKIELLKIIGTQYKEKIKVVRMGVVVPQSITDSQKIKKLFIIVTPANLLEVKGHKYLIEACSDLLKQGIKKFQCIFFGEGPLKTELKNLIEKKGLAKYIKIAGVIPHQNLIELYRNREIDLVILPSVNTSKNEHEGIPVALMEAMAYKIPVISTNTGAIPELLRGAGLIVEEKSPKQLFNAILLIMQKRNLRKELSIKGYKKVKKEFNITKNAETMLKLISNYLWQRQL